MLDSQESIKFLSIRIAVNKIYESMREKNIENSF